MWLHLCLVCGGKNEDKLNQEEAEFNTEEDKHSYSQLCLNSTALLLRTQAILDLDVVKSIIICLHNSRLCLQSCSPVWMEKRAVEL